MSISDNTHMRTRRIEWLHRIWNCVFIRLKRMKKRLAINRFKFQDKFFNTFLIKRLQKGNRSTYLTSLCNNLNTYLRIGV